MYIDDSIVKNYLEGKKDYICHWLFYSITENGEYAYAEPLENIREQVKQLYALTYDSLKNFCPFNEKIYTELFPAWRILIKDVNVLLSVGSPKPYDAMVREHEGKAYMIFDLARLLEYGKTSDEMISVIRGMITHEFAHMCIHNDYPWKADEYKDRLKLIAFDEGFAHLLAFNENIMGYDFSEMIALHYHEALEKLKDALEERDTEKQEKLLEEADSGRYWSKFASISGKLYLASHLDSLNDIYQAGPEAMIRNMVG